MPGFNINSGSPDQPGARSEPRRQHRWLVTLTIDNEQFSVYLKKATRPEFSLNAVEMHHNQEVSYHVGKQTWNELTLEFYDIEVDPDISAKIFEWVNGGSNSPIISGLASASETVNVNPASTYKATVAEVQMLDGSGNPTETWKYHNVWPIKTNWNELDFSSDEIMLVTVNCRYDRATKE